MFFPVFWDFFEQYVFYLVLGLLFNLENNSYSRVLSRTEVLKSVTRSVLLTHLNPLLKLQRKNV